MYVCIYVCIYIYILLVSMFQHTCDTFPILPTHLTEICFSLSRSLSSPARMRLDADEGAIIWRLDTALRVRDASNTTVTLLTPQPTC